VPSGGTSIRPVRNTLISNRPQGLTLIFREAGLNELFSDRVEEHIYHDPVIRKELPKEDYPDRIYGLRRTKHFDRVLSKRYLHEHPEDGPTRLISDVIPSSPFDTSVENLLFPFLIIEAKSEKGSVGFDNIQAQTAFPIRALLVLQDKLHQAANNDTIQIGRPLVWFIACQGDLWRLYAAYPDHHQGETKYVCHLCGLLPFEDADLLIASSCIVGRTTYHKGWSATNYSSDRLYIRMGS
jgi:hypothetical protein